MNKNILYFECYAGISGDMVVASLLDLGADEEVLAYALNSLPIHGFRTEIRRVKKGGIDCCDFNVILDRENSHSNHEVHHRNLQDINEIIESSQLTSSAKAMAKKIFHIIAESESKAHSIPIEQVHFHEVGAVDSIVDIAAAAVCLDNLNIGEVIVSELYEGYGHTSCQHGILPIPVPAVVNIATQYKFPIRITNVQGEFITPTGIGIVAAIKTREDLPESFTIQKIGLGAGKRNYEKANILRAMLIDPVNPQSINKADSDFVWVLEANIDDCSGEALSYTMEQLFEQGARDVYYTPVFMKKGRPAYLLTAICQKEDVSKLESAIFSNTTTIGIRKYLSARTILKRIIIEITTEWGSAKIKVCEYGQNTYFYPEYESVRTLCSSSGKDFITLYDALKHIASESYQPK